MHVSFSFGMALFSRKGKMGGFPVRESALFVRPRWHAQRRRLTFLLLLAVITFPFLCVVLYVLFYDGPAPPDPSSLAPPMSARVFPFRDLCDAAANTLAEAETPGEQQQRRVRQRMDRLAHIPADGGAAGVRWRAATGLPLLPHRVGREVRAHVVTLSTRTDDFAQATTTAATMAGVPLEVIGVGWTWFSFSRRMEILRSFLDLSNVTDDDVVVSMDADAILSGEDVYDSLAAFVASTASNVTEHETYPVRDIRRGRRQPPVLFGAELNCMHAQAYPSRHLCPTGYDAVDGMMQTWAVQAGVPLPSPHRGVNPFRYLNAGVVVARVWALRCVWAAARDFMATHNFYEGDEWWCDQSVLGSLYLQLRWWELRSAALDQAVPAPLSPQAKEECLFAPLVLPDPHRGPHGLPGGLIGLDHEGRFSLVLSMQVEPAGVVQVGGTPITQARSPEGALFTFLQSSGWMEKSFLTPLRSSHKVELVPRRGFDCGAEGAAETEASRPPECGYRAAVLGMPGEATAVAPLIWHFAGKQKRLVLTRFRVVFPWYTPMLWNVSVRRSVVRTLSTAPPTRLWYLNATTDWPFEGVVHTLYPHRREDDVTFERMCELSRAPFARPQ